MQSRLIRPETGRPSPGGDVGHTIARAFGNRGRPATGADEPVNERGPGSCDLVIGDTSHDVIPFRRMSVMSPPCFRML